jgi:hypothetical protein
MQKDRIVAGFLERCDQLRPLQFVDIADDNGCAPLREQFCDLSADTRCPACHQRNLALELSRHVLFPIIVAISEATG